MSSAYLASSRTHVHPAQPDLVRICALSLALAINIMVFVVATRPLPPLSMPHLASTPPLGLRMIDPPKPRTLPPPPPPIHMPIRRQPTHVQPTHPSVAGTPHVSDEGNQAATIIQVPTIAPPATGVSTVAVSTVPVEASLAYRSAPLSYPTQAIRRHMHGTVLLRVLVDELGKPVEVIVERSSGYALLDRSARQQVLAGWRFQPASLGGRAVRAWAKVPVSFDLRAL
jgi:protein TonB